MKQYTFSKISTAYIRGDGFGFMVRDGVAIIDESQPHIVELAKAKGGKPVTKTAKPKAKRGKK